MSFNLVTTWVVCYLTTLAVTENMLHISEWAQITDVKVLRMDNRSTWSKETCPTGNLSTKNPTRSGLGLSPDLRDEKPETNRLGHCTNLALVSGVRDFFKQEILFELRHAKFTSNWFKYPSCSLLSKTVDNVWQQISKARPITVRNVGRDLKIKTARYSRTVSLSVLYDSQN